MITYSIMIVHECAHLIAAKVIGLKISYIAIQPFGINLRLKNKIIGSVSDEVILYLSGPLINAVFAVISIVAYNYSKNIYLYDFYLKNTSLFIINMLPIIPLDGGIILKKIIMYRKGYKYAQQLMIVISSVFISILIVIGIYYIYISKANFSIIFLIIFMIANIFTQREKYNIDFIQEIIHYKDKPYKNKEVKIYAVPYDEKLQNISLKFNIKNFYIVFFIKNNGSIDDILTETEIIERVTSKNKVR